MIQSSLEFKEQRIQHLTAVQENTDQLTQEQAQELAKNEKERLELIKKIKKLELNLDKTMLNLDATKTEVKDLKHSVQRKEILELDAFDIAKSVAQSKNATVLILGESGTGKELIAQAVHKMSARRDKQFIAINCAALPETLLKMNFSAMKKGASPMPTNRCGADSNGLMGAHSF